MEGCTASDLNAGVVVIKKDELLQWFNSQQAHEFSQHHSSLVKAIHGEKGVEVGSIGSIVNMFKKEEKEMEEMEEENILSDHFGEDEKSSSSEPEKKGKSKSQKRNERRKQSKARTKRGDWVSLFKSR